MTGKFGTASWHRFYSLKISTHCTGVIYFIQVMKRNTSIISLYCSRIWIWVMVEIIKRLKWTIICFQSGLGGNNLEDKLCAVRWPLYLAEVGISDFLQLEAAKFHSLDLLIIFSTSTFITSILTSPVAMEKAKKVKHINLQLVCSMCTLIIGRLCNVYSHDRSSVQCLLS